MKDIHKLLLLLILFPIDLNEFVKFADNKAQKITEGKHLLKRILTPSKYLQLLEGTYFLNSAIRNKVIIDKIAFTEFLIDEKNVPFLIYCLKRYAHSKNHPISRYFVSELSVFV